MEPRRALIARFVLLAVIGLPIGACSAGAPAASPSPTPPAIVCHDAAAQVKTPGQLTFSTTDPSYGPWYEDDPAVQYAIEPTGAPNWHVTDPYSMHGFEAGVAYSLANAIGFEPDHVRWVPNTRDGALAPGAKNFDIYLAQVPAPASASAAVDFSDPYLDSFQAVVATPTNPVTGAKRVSDLSGFNLGVIAGTSSESLVSQVIKPTSPAKTYVDEVAAVAALKTREIDAFVTDIATAFFQLDGPGGGEPAALPDGVVVGKFDPSVWDDHLGLVLEKGSPLLACANSALADIKRDGSLDEFRNEDIPVGENVPTFQ